MRYVLKQKLFALSSSFVVKDEHDRDAFFVEGKILTIGKKLSFQDAGRNEVAFIRQRLFAWGPTYEILRDGRLVATVKKHLFTFWHCRFIVTLPGSTGLEVRGNVLDHEYELMRGDWAIATVSKKWFSWTDTYAVDVADGEDPVLAVAIAVVIDMVCHAKRG